MWRFPFSSKWKNSVSCCRKEPQIPFFISPFRQRHGIAILEAFSDITVTEVAISSFEEQLTSFPLLPPPLFCRKFRVWGQNYGSGDVVVVFFLFPRSSAHGIIAIIPSIHNGPQGNRCPQDTIRKQFFPTICVYFSARNCFSQARF